MKLGWILGIFGAVAAHAAIILFGGLLFPSARKDAPKLQDVELLSTDEEAEKEKPKETPPEEKPQELEQPDEKPPEIVEAVRSLDTNPMEVAPALDAASLSSIEAALNGGGGGGDFADALSFASGGRIGGTGKAGGVGEAMENAFNLTEIDQKPRAMFLATPLYPSEMRGKKVEGSVTVIFVVDSSGRVSDPRLVTSTHPAFVKPALDAVKQWKFEPAVKGGQRVGCKMRETIRFQAS